jgi:RIP metalloprotease RseP
MMVIYAIFVLGILIFVHEFGHFIVAKLFNVKVEKFSLGFGPKLFGKQIGETEYLLSAFPLGGYVKMFGEGGVIEGAPPQTSDDTTHCHRHGRTGFQSGLCLVDLHRNMHDRCANGYCQDRRGT